MSTPLTANEIQTRESRHTNKMVSNISSLYTLGETVGRAERLEEIYEVALDTLQCTIAADRAAVLLCDHDQVMRFKASRGLSDEYMQAVQGHSPWSGNEEYPLPILVPDVGNEPSLQTLQPVIQKEGIEALAFIPLMYQGRLLGKFMVYFNTVHQLTDEEIQVIQTIARHVAFAIGQRQSESALRDSEQRYRSVVNSLKEVIFQTDAQGLWVFLNPAWMDLTGFSVEESIGQTFLRYVHPDDQDRSLEMFTSMIEGEKSQCRHEIRCLTKDDGFKWIEFFGRRRPDAHNQVLGISGTLTDITERKWMEDVLARKEKLYRTLFELSPAPILLLKADSKILDANEALCESLGYQREELIGKDIRMLVPPEDYHRVDEHIQKIVAGERLQHEVDNIRRDGVRRRLELRETSIPLPDGQEGILSVANDITDRKQAEDALRQREFWLKESQRVGQIGSYDLDIREGKWASSDVLDDIFGIEHDAEKSVASWNALVHPEHREEMLDYFLKYVVAGKNPFDKEYKIVRARDGAVRWLWGKGELQYDEHGTPIRMIGTIQDITERKQTQELLAASEQSYRGLFNSIADAIYVQDGDGKFLDVNEGATEMYGYSREFFLGKTPEFLSAPNKNDMEATAEMIQRAFAGEPQHFEWWGIRKSGEVFPKDVRLTKGSYFGKDVIIAVARDITERVNAEQQRRRRLLFANALNEVAEVILTNDEPTTLLDSIATIIGKTIQVDRLLIFDISLAQQQIIGLSEWLNPSHTDITPAKSIYPLERFIGGANEMQSSRKWVESHSDAVNPVTIADGSNVFLHDKMRIKSGLWYPFAFYDGGYYVIALNQVFYRRVWQDDEIEFLDAVGRQVGIALVKIQLMAKREKAEKEFADERTLLKTIVDLLPDAVYVKDLSGRKVFANKCELQLLGAASESEVLGKTDFDMYSEKEAAGYEENDQSVLNSGTPKLNVEVPFTSRTGDAYWLQNSKVPLKDATGTTVGLVGVSHDITERKRAEQEARESRDQLRELAQHLQSVREDERKTISREIHDELGQALTSLRIDLGWMENRMPASEKQLRDRTSSMIGLVDKTIITVQQLSTMLRPGMLDELGLAAAIEWQANEFERRTGIRCSIKQLDEYPELNEERATAVFRIFQETLTNIARHSKATGVEVRLQVRKDDLTLDVRDNGRGIRPEEITNLKSIGLLGMKERALAVGGELTVSGTAEKGTTMKVVVPII